MLDVLVAAGVLHALLGCAETRQLVCKIMAGWNQSPLVAALTSQQVTLQHTRLQATD